MVVDKKRTNDRLAGLPAVRERGDVGNQNVANAEDRSFNSATPVKLEIQLPFQGMAYALDQPKQLPGTCGIQAQRFIDVRESK